MGIRGEQERKLSALDMVHPTVQLGCFAIIVLFAMMALQPVFLIVSLLAAYSFRVYARGWRLALRTLVWQMPLIALCAVFNSLFSASGSSELFRVGTWVVCVENIVYGLCMGIMLSTMALWFINAAQVLSSDKVLAVWGNSMPTVGLMISMALRLVPQFVERGKLIDSATQAASAAAARNKAEKMAARIRLVSVLVGWSMEDSLETADAMRAKGWGASKQRTSYPRYRFGSFDLGVSIVLGLLALVTALLVWVACSQYQFYPTLSTLILWWGYIPYVLLMFLPLLACLIDDFREKRMTKRAAIRAEKRSESGRHEYP